MGLCDRVRGDPHLLLLGAGPGISRMGETEHTGRCLCGAGPLPRNRYAQVDRELSLRELPARDRRAVHHVRRICRRTLRVRRGRAGALPLLARRDPDLLREVRHAAHLSGRALAGRGARADRQHGPAAGLRPDPRCLRRGEAALAACERPEPRVTAADSAAIRSMRPIAPGISAMSTRRALVETRCPACESWFASRPWSSFSVAYAAAILGAAAHANGRPCLRCGETLDRLRPGSGQRNGTA